MKNTLKCLMKDKKKKMLYFRNTMDANILDIERKKSEVEKILELAEELQEKCSFLGFNAFQPGAIKELKMAYILGHNWIVSKKSADACSREDVRELYEYLSGTEEGSGQIDRFFKDSDNEEQHEKHLKSVERINRNKMFYLAYTNKDTSKPLDILRIYEVETNKILAEAKRQLEISTNNISHIGFNENFAKQNGKLVHEKCL